MLHFIVITTHIDHAIFTNIYEFHCRSLHKSLHKSSKPSAGSVLGGFESGQTVIFSKPVGTNSNRFNVSISPVVTICYNKTSFPKLETYAVADLGFPRGAPTYYLTNFSPKLHENEEILALEANVPCAPQIRHWYVCETLFLLATRGVTMS